jgi:lipopolysaccharide assembly protein A
MRTFLRVIRTTIGAAAFLLLLGFAVKNTDSVTVRYFLGLEWRAPLVFVLLVFFAVGIVLGVMASLTAIVRQRRQIFGLKRELRGRARTASPSLADPA